ncbi:MAG: MmcQ/YjbR family DNA-binding protein [Actinomycetota bacterium]|nr:MmcQ/YjbR family DNA-binding protein [Actinomycetota bacterium]
MATWDDVRRLAMALPETTEDERTWRVRKKLVAWERPLRAKDYEALGDAAWGGDILGARRADQGAKEALLADDPEVYFTTPHFDGYPAILVRLERIAEAELAELLGEAWLAQAPKRLAQSYLDSLDRPQGGTT